MKMSRIRKLGHLLHIMQFALEGKHPKKVSIAAAYLRFHWRFFVSKILGRPLHSFPLLGTTMTFSNPKTFRFLMWEIFIDECYKIDMSSRGDQDHPRTILDCGSNIGMTILFFKSLWAEAHITGVEASPETFSLLQKNVLEMPHVSVLNLAVSDRYGQIPFYSASSNSLAWSAFALRGDGQPTLVNAIPMADLINGPVDLLKMDIEGSEIAAFVNLEASGKMPLIREMLIEYHHHLSGQAEGLSPFLDRLSRCGFDYELSAGLPQNFGDFQDILIRARYVGDPLPAMPVA